MLLQGLKPFVPAFQDGDQFFRPTVKKGLVLQIISCTPPLPFVLQYPAINDLLSKSTKFFKVLVGLPPLRGHEHQIVLKEGSPPIYKRPYKYTFYEKTKIEKIVHELLQVGSIRVSQMQQFFHP